MTFRRNLLVHPNRCHDLAAINGYQDIGGHLIEDNEVYEWYRHAIILKDNSIGSVIRRNYGNSRDTVDAACSIDEADSQPTDRGDSFVILYPGRDTIIENNISEGVGSGIQLVGFSSSTSTQDNLLKGNISLSDDRGVSVFFFDFPPLRTTIVDQVVFPIRATDAGITSTFGSTTTVIDGASVFGTTGRGYYFDEPFASSTSAALRNAVSMPDKAIEGFESHFDTFTCTNCAASVNQFTPAVTDAGITGEFLTAPTNINTGGCPWIPATSNLKGAGTGTGASHINTDIGANVLYKSVNGVVTSEVLWNASTGVFTGCGVTVSGVNDVAGESCVNVHTRLNVNGTNCPFPAGYGGAGSGTITVTWPYPANTIFQRPTSATMSIQWSSTDITGTVDLDYSTDNGATWTFIASPAYNSSPYLFDADAAKVPATSAFLIRVSQGPVDDISDNTATVRGRWVR